MLTKQAKKELLEQKKRLEEVLLYGELNDNIRKELLTRIKSVKLAIKEIDRLESECER